MEYKVAGTRARAPRILGDSDIMRLRWNMPKAAWSCLSLSTIFLAAALTGCNSAPDPNSADAQKYREERNAAIQKEEQAASKGKGKKAVPVKSIKGNLNPTGTGAQ
jgi:hypothetical protein